MSDVKEYHIYAIKAFRVVDGRSVEKTIKVGCTSNIKNRIKKYNREMQEDFRVEILEVIIGTDKEAGDREHYWADIFGTKPGHRYEQSSERLRNFITTVSKEDRKKLGIGSENNPGIKDAEYRKEKSIGFEALSEERRREIAARGGRSHSSEFYAANGKKGAAARWSKKYPDRYQH
jgi:hypothetical protein